MQLETTPTTEEEPPQSNRRIVIFDGVCGLCNASVDFIIRHDTDKIFVFAPNQNESAKEILTREGLDPDQIETIYLYQDGILYSKSEAVVRISSSLPFPWRLATAGRVIPRPIRDWAYTLVATNRYRWFGRSETCRIPTPEERARFLD